jgi:Xaa-Pro aminopeptidase
MEKNDIDIFLVARPSSIYYYTGTSAAEILVVSAGSDPLLLGPRHDVPKALDQAPDCAR